MNETTIDGVRYVAKPGAPDSCEGCAGDGKFNIMLCGALPPCTADERADGVPVIWVEVKE